MYGTKANEMGKLNYNEMKKKSSQFETLLESEKNVPNAELTKLNIKRLKLIMKKVSVNGEVSVPLTDCEGEKLYSAVTKSGYIKISYAE